MLKYPWFSKTLIPFSDAPKVKFRVNGGKHAYGIIETR